METLRDQVCRSSSCWASYFRSDFGYTHSAAALCTYMIKREYFSRRRGGRGGCGGSELVLVSRRSLPGCLYVQIILSRQALVEASSNCKVPYLNHLLDNPASGGRVGVGKGVYTVRIPSSFKGSTVVGS